MWKNIVQPGRPQMTIWRIARWIRKATNTLSEHVILIALPLLQWLKERSSMLRYMLCTLIVCFIHVTVALQDSTALPLTPPPPTTTTTNTTATTTARHRVHQYFSISV